MDQKPLLPIPEAQIVTKWVKPELQVFNVAKNTLGNTGPGDDGAASS